MGKQATRSTFSLSRRSRVRYIENEVSKIVKPRILKTVTVKQFADSYLTPDLTISSDLDCLSASNDSISSSDIEENQFVAEQLEPATPHSSNFFSETTSENFKNFNILESLRDWSLENNISRTAFSDLLRKLKQHECFKNLPVDPRTVLSTLPLLQRPLLAMEILFTLGYYMV
ncbi:unnamed protein product [Orchesella dallaii]|uniref:Uncharacterized protein n=1 Tax=Orchesella dallaii TaxID=48710 RepID=A0ABP1RJF3_9HEXA